MYKVSVIIPTYNREKTIERCICSVTNQTYKPHEIIIIDDGSEDSTIKIIEQMNISLVRIICQNHKGAQAARNLGIMNATGEYIAFLDSDDEWVENKLEKQILLAEKYKDRVIYSDCYVVEEHNLRRKYWKLPGGNGNIHKFLLMYPGPMFQGMLIKKQWLVKIGMLDENVVAYQEWETAIRLAERYAFFHIKEPLFLYHKHTGETISKNGVKGIKGYIYIVRKHYRMIIKKCGLMGIKHHSIIIFMLIKNYYLSKYK